MKYTFYRKESIDQFYHEKAINLLSVSYYILAVVVEEKVSGELMGIA